MDNQEYLNQISGAARTSKKTKSGILSSPFFKVGVIGGAALVFFLILGAILGAGKTGVKEQCFSLKLRLDNTLEIISTYQTDVKSSDLRSSSASLYSILSNTSRDLTNYVTEKYNYKEKSVPKNLVETATLEKDGLGAELFEAKINGILDRIYAHKMAYEISWITTNEATIFNATNDEALKSLLTTSYDSLNNLYEKFSDFSETN